MRNALSNFLLKRRRRWKLYFKGLSKRVFSILVDRMLEKVIDWIILPSVVAIFSLFPNFSDDLSQDAAIHIRDQPFAAKCHADIHLLADDL